MKAIAFDHFGGPDVLTLRDLPTPLPKDHEVQIRLEYAGVNPVDYKIREGYLKDAFQHEFPVICGWEGSGRVTEVGKDCKDIRVNDTVYGYFRLPVIHSGCYAEYITVPEEYVVRIPQSLTTKEAAVIPLASLTAWQALFDAAKLDAGQTVVVHAAGGGVGGMAVQLAKWANATVIATAQKHNHDYVKALGADYVIDYTKEDVKSKVLQIAPDGVDVVLDCVGGDVTAKCFEYVSSGSTVVSIADRQIAAKAPEQVFAFFVFVEPQRYQLQKIGQLYDAKKLIVPPMREFRLDEAKKAQELVQSRHVAGKVVLHINLAHSPGH